MTTTTTTTFFLSVLLLLCSVDDSKEDGGDVTVLVELKRSACKYSTQCKKATEMNEKAIEAYFNFLGIQDYNIQTMQALLLDNMELRFKLYGVCNSEQGQYLSFVKRDDPSILTASQCLFESEEDELKARRNIGGSHSKSIVSYSHPCFEQEGETVYVILLLILIFIAIAVVMHIYDVIRMSSLSSYKYGADLTKMFLRSEKRK